jgi:hypothetical protein
VPDFANHLMMQNPFNQLGNANRFFLSDPVADRPQLIQHVIQPMSSDRYKK